MDNHHKKKSSCTNSLGSSRINQTANLEALMQIGLQVTKSIQQYNQKTTHRQMKLSQVPYPKEKSNRSYSDFKRQQDKSISFNK